MISYLILIIEISIIISKVDTLPHLAELAIVLTIELSLFKQDQINLAHLLSKLITIGTDELIDDKRLQCVVFGIFQSRRIDFRHAVKNISTSCLL